MTTALLARAGTPDQASHPNQHPLLSVTWLDLSSLPLDEGAPQTLEDALADTLMEEWAVQYQAQIDALQQRHQGIDTTDPWDAAREAQLRAKATALAKGRLDQYQDRLKKFLATSPSEDDLAGWLANRATNDAGIWARMDALDVRDQATTDFYDLNPAAKVLPADQKWTIVPDHAAESRCQAVVGELYDTYDEASMALSMAIHKNCPHFVSPA